MLKIEVINYFTLTLLNLTAALYPLNPLTTYLAHYSPTPPPNYLFSLLLTTSFITTS